ncbi:MAG TPA: hydrogenase maturation protease [Thermoanaerobaculaceae bacterium]|nr:hydrogenase maturation protease [Thermoanaerobaculaceae bacterium]
MATAGTLVLGLGNDLVADDGFGPAVARECRRALGGREGVAVEEASAAGLRLLDLLVGYRRALILDVVQTARVPPGTLLEWPLGGGDRARTLGGSHQCDPLTALALGRALGFELPDEVRLVVAEAEDLETIRESMSPAVAAAARRALALVGEWIDRRGPFSPAAGRDHEQARILS